MKATSRRFHFTFRYLYIIFLLDEFSFTANASGSNERIRFQRHLGRSGGFHHLGLEEYEQQLAQCPRIRHWSDDLERKDFNSDGDIIAIFIKSPTGRVQKQRSELPLLSCVSETRTNEVESHHFSKTNPDQVIQLLPS